VLIVIGTQTLNALEAAERLQGYLSCWGYPTRLRFAEEVRPAELSQEERVLFCLSTWCWISRPKEPADLLPQGASWLYQRLESTRPDLSRLRYAVCALGERAYGPYFCKAGSIYTQLLGRLGARPLQCRLELASPVESWEELGDWAMALAVSLKSKVQL
jgi:MioC protein